MKNRQLAHRSFVRRSLCLEQLQQRAMLAGNVAAYVNGGSLSIIGDDNDNQLQITQIDNDRVRITSLDNTTINNNLSTAIFKVNRGYFINMGDGDDVLKMSGIRIDINKDLVVRMGDGDDDLQFNNVKVLRIRAILGEGNDTVTVANTKVERSLNIFGAAGDDQITLRNSKFGQKSVIDGNTGSNSIVRSNVKFGPKLQFRNLSGGATPGTITAATDTSTVTEGQMNAILSVLANDTASTGATFDLTKLTITQNPTNGTATVNANGTINYTHNGSNTTADTFKYSIQDTSGATATGTVNLTVTPVNDAPTAVNDATSLAVGVTRIISVTTNDTDADGTIDPATIVITAQPTNGSATVNTNGTISYTHNGTATTTDSISYTIKDNNGLVSANPAVVAITIVANNVAPVANSDTATVAEGGNIAITALTNDTDSNGTLDTTSVAIVTQPANGTVTVNSNGTIQYTHNGSNTLTDSFTYTVRDNLGAISNAATVSITVTAVNDAPVAVADTVSAVRGATTNLNLATNDTDSEGALNLASIVIVANPTNGTITVKTDGTVDYINNGNAATSDSFTYNIKDTGGSTSNTVTVTINVTAANQAPTAGNDSQTVAEGAAATVTVLSNDEDDDGTLNVTTVTIVTPPSNGTAVPQANGTIIYTHNGSETSSDSFTYRVKDNLGLDSNTATVTITVTPVNDAPVAVAESANVNEAGSVVVDVAANDTDVDNAKDLNSIVIGTQPTNGTLTVNGDGTVTYQHNGSETLTDSFTYTIKDVSGATSGPATVTITVAPVNDLPVAVANTGTVSEGASVIVDLATNDTDADGTIDDTTIAIVQQPANGSVTVATDGTITYQHNGGETTTDSFTYTIQDNSGAVSLAGTVNITITPINDLPVAVANTGTVAEGDSVVIDLATNDTDADGTIDDATIAIVQSATNGSVTVHADGTITYEHNGGETTTDSFTYTIQDNSGGVSLAGTVNITITPVNDTPSGVNDAGSATEDSGLVTNGNVLTNDTDPDTTTLNVAEVDGLFANVGADVAGQFGTFHINSDGSYTYDLNDSLAAVNALNNGDTLNDSITYKVSDGNTTSALTATLSVTITGNTDTA